MGKALISAKTKRRARQGLAAFVVWALRQPWRFRAGLAPAWGCLGLAVAGWILAGEGVPAPAPALLACLVALAIWFGGERMSPRVQRAWLYLAPKSVDDGRKGVLDRPTERGYLAVLLLGSGAWLAVRIRLGWVEPTEWGLLALTGALGAPWWWHRGWRRRRPFNPWVRRWAGVNANDDLKVWHKSKIVEVSGTTAVVVLRVRLRRGLTINHVGRDSLILDSALGLRGGATSVTLHPRAAMDVVVRIVPRDPWTSPIPHPLPALRSLDLGTVRRIPVGKLDDASDSMLKLCQHMLIVGASGSGKSEWLQSLLAWTLAFEHVVIIAADLAGGATLDVWEPILAAPLATTVREAFDLLGQVLRLIEYREAEIKRRRRAGELINILPTSAEFPAVFFVIDEFPDLIAGAKMETGEDGEKLPVMNILERIAKRARKGNIWLRLACQNPGVDDVGSTTLRGQLTATIGLGLDQRQSMTLWGSLRKEGWDSEALSEGSYLLRDRNDPDHRVPRVAKGQLLTPAERLDLIERASRQPARFTGEEARIIPANPARMVIEGDTVAGGNPEVDPVVPRPRLAIVARDGEPVERGNPAPAPTIPAREPVASVTGIPRRPAARSRPARTRDLDERVWAEIPDAHQGGVGGTELAEQLQVGRSQVQRAFERLADEGRVRNMGNGKWCRT